MQHYLRVGQCLQSYLDHDSVFVVPDQLLALFEPYVHGYRVMHLHQSMGKDLSQLLLTCGEKEIRRFYH